MREFTAEELVGTRWAGGPVGTGLIIAAIAQDGRFHVVFNGGMEAKLSLAELTGMGYWRVTQSFTELANEMTERGSAHFMPVPGFYGSVPQAVADIALELGSVESYIQAGRQGTCEGDCAPTHPCYAKVCPQWKEDECAASDWYYVHGEGIALELAVEAARFRPSPMPELRCAQEWGCGLVRTR